MTPTTNFPVLEVTDMHFGWPGIPLFQGMSFQVPVGVSVVHGEESSGKTTLLKLLAGDLRADSGAFVLRNILLKTHADAYRAQVFRTEPRSDALDAISAQAWFATLVSRYPRFNLETAKELARGFALETHIDKPMYMLSAGSKRKVWLSAAFSAGTVLTLIDEPFAALDMGSIRFLKALLKEASEHTERAWVLADHAPPEGLAVKTQLMLGKS